MAGYVCVQKAAYKTQHPCCMLQIVVDIATLTGAAGVALGQTTATLFANTDSLAAAVDGASKKTGVWLLHQGRV
jgi:leucyl aminopeptidase